MLALLALVSGLLLVIPDDDEQTYSMSAGSDLAGDSVSSGLGELAAGRAADSVGSTTPTSITKVAGETGVFSEADMARLALATEAALVGADESLSSSAAALSLADEIALAQQAMAALSPSATTQPPPTTVKTTTKPSTTVAPMAANAAAETTVAPTTASVAENPTTETAEETTTPTTAAESPAAEPGESTDSETTVAEATTTETTAVDTSAAETSAPETTVAETTVPETTVPETTAAQGWVDTGNGVLVPPVLLAIRWCESTDNYTAANPSSSARGGYQFLTGSWKAYGHKDRYGVSQAHLATPAQQDEAALITWERDGTRPWNASKSCWSKRI
ncbi:MAG: transglycosylase family protein [Acidimicrobiales bacterium]